MISTKLWPSCLSPGNNLQNRDARTYGISCGWHFKSQHVYYAEVNSLDICHGIWKFCAPSAASKTIELQVYGFRPASISFTTLPSIEPLNRRTKILSLTIRVSIHQKEGYRRLCSRPTLSCNIALDSLSPITLLLHRWRHQTKGIENSWFRGLSARVPRETSCCKDACYYQNMAMHRSWSEAAIWFGRWSIQTMKVSAYAGLPKRACQSHKLYLDLFMSS
jgi:hypothetical protein